MRGAPENGRARERARALRYNCANPTPEPQLNHRNVCLVGLAAVITVLAGCAAQYRNPDACVAEMRGRLDETSNDGLKITNRAVSYRGQRVVIEGRLGRALAPDAASAAGGAARGQTSASTASATQAAASTLPASAAKPEAASAAGAAPDREKPTTPVGALVAHFSRSGKATPVAAECTFDESGLTSFRWLAPAALAKTTPAPAHGD